MMPRFSKITALFVSAILLAACGTPNSNTPLPFATLTPGSPTAPTLQATSAHPVEATTTAPATFYIQPGVPQSIAASVVGTLAQAGYVQNESPVGTVLRVVLDPPQDAALSAQWVYAMVEPFPFIREDYSWSAFQGFWQDHETIPLATGYEPYYEPRRAFALTQDVVDILDIKLGAHDQPRTYAPVRVLGSTAEIAGNIWLDPSFAIVPFDALEPRVKVLAIDGRNPLDKTIDVNSYPLTVNIGVVADGAAGAQAVGVLQPAWQVTNRDVSKMDYVTMTGVTALSRAVAKSMETYGIDYPARQLLPFLSDADILHTSNEASFDVECPEQDWFGDPVFCEHRKYYDLLSYVGIDIVELTGNHNLDYGIDAAINSLDIYDVEGLPYFGGGRNLEDATTPRILAGSSGTRYAFLGCNSAGPFGAWATAETPGAAPCDDWVRIQQQIAGLKAGGEADVVIVTLQYLELDSYAPSDEQREEFEALSAAGADIVSGSQAHQPQGFSFVDGRFVHFGVGNIFFDQIDYPENRQMFIDKHVFYNGRHLSTILFTGWFEEVAQARPMTAEERADLLMTVFEASGW
jgi:hypothetical protein